MDDTVERNVNIAVDIKRITEVRLQINLSKA